SIMGPAVAAEGFVAQLTAVAHFENGSSQPITADANWSVIPTVVGEFIAPGQLSIGEVGATDVQAPVRATYALGGRARAGTRPLQIRATGGAGTALQFDGQNDRVQLPAAAMNGIDD